ncbi:hypothetical protein KFK09_023291 [Dendrobium nobile]|uniref:Protein kinase domain-containing protein n=1 Tax=Dendrobium nobile TaxID=94219 RepID=A0A8T3AS90_DENNO|nr:hypothetical protein KFK09_023291 [Dendrobium nobile]
MENESCSWITRAKFSQNTFIRSGSSRFLSFRLDCQSDRDLDLKKESSSSDSMARDSGLGFSTAAFMAGSFVQLSNTSSVSEGKPLATSGRKTDGKSESKMRDSSLVSSDSISCKSSLQHGSSESSLILMKESNLQPVGFSFHPNLRATIDTLKLFSYAVWFDSSRKKLAQMKRKSKPKRRSISPQPTTILSDLFKEAKSHSKRFSTPPRSRIKQDNNELSTLQQISFVKGIIKLRAKKERPWARYFDNGVVRVTAVETTEKWIVNLSELYFGARFACGAHSRLYHGMYKNQPVAVKLIRLPDEDDSGVMVARLEKQFTREATFLSHLCHRNVIKLAGFCKKSPILFIITEYLSGGSLWALLRKLDRSPLPLDNLISIALDVARGMEYIHSQGVIHRDLKSGNILFDNNLCVKIADFGVACEEAYCDVLGDEAGTYRWMAPEMIKHKPYGRKVDVYSFGLLLWEMITGAIPYEEMTPVQAAFAVVNKNLRPVIPADCPVVLRMLTEQCWSTLPEKRPEFWQIVKVLEQFESDLVHRGTLEQLQFSSRQDHKKGLLVWIEKLRPSKVDSFSPPNAKKL